MTEMEFNNIVDFNLCKNTGNAEDTFIVYGQNGTYEFSLDECSHNTVHETQCELVGIYPLPKSNQMRILFKCTECSIIFEDLYDYGGFNTYEELGIDNPYKKNTLNLNNALNFLRDHRYEITEKNDNTFILNDIDDDSPLEVYDEDELIQLAKTIEEELK